jgi:Ring finger domain
MVTRLGPRLFGLVLYFGVLLAFVMVFWITHIEEVYQMQSADVISSVDNGQPVSTSTRNTTSNSTSFLPTLTPSSGGAAGNDAQRKRLAILIVSLFSIVTTWALLHMVIAARNLYARFGPAGQATNRGAIARSPFLLAQLGGNIGDNARLLNDPNFQTRLRMAFMRRNFNGDDYEMLQQLDEGINSTTARGASEESISRLPLHTIRSSELQSRSESHANSCSVCLGQFQEGETVRTLPCLHQFHQDCVDRWLVQKATCPVCKASL